METFWQDVKYGVRMLRKNAGFTLVAVLTLALGIGANTAVFSLTDQVLLRLLPVERPEELVVFRSPGPRTGHVWSDTDNGAQSFSYPLYKDLRDRATVFSGVLARHAISLSVAGTDRTERASGELVSGNYFQVLGVRPSLGRLFMPEDDVAPGGHPLAVLSHNYWTRRFGANPGVLNETLTINGYPMTVVGVAGARFNGVQLGQMPDVFIPITMKAQMTPNQDDLENRKSHWLAILGRLKPGVSREQGEAALAPIFRALQEQEAAELKGWNPKDRAEFLNRKMLLLPGGQGRLVLQDDAKDALLLLSTLVGLVLLIACANIANLLLARGVSRQREIAVRLALGAQRLRLVRQLLAESLILSLAGGVAGLLVAAWTTDAILAWLPQGQGFAGLSSSLDLRLLVFNFGVALLMGLAFGLVPALRATRPDLVTQLKEQGAGGFASREHVHLRKGLVVGQIAFTAMLLITAGVFARSLGELRRVDLGMKVDNLLQFSIEPELNRYTPPQTVALIDRLREELGAMPGVTSVSAAQLPVIADTTASRGITVEGYRAQEGEDTYAFLNWVGPRFFSTMGIPLLAGREFTESDAATSPQVAIISETMARTYFPGRNPVGMHLGFGPGNAARTDIEVVGVVKDSKHATVRQRQRPFVFLPYAQDPRIGNITFYVRSSQAPTLLATAVQQTVRRHDANLPIFDLKTLARQVDESLFVDRFLTLLAVCFGVLAAALAALGLYGVMAYTVARRTREIGIRMALGASLGNVRGLVLREAVVLAILGLGIGLPAAAAAGRLVVSLVFGVHPDDPVLFGAAGLLLVGVMLLAAYIPARRASRVDPMVALRYE